MKTLYKTIAAAALITGTAVAANANVAADENNPGINDQGYMMAADTLTTEPLLEPSTSFDVNGDPVRRLRMGEELLANAYTEDASDPYSTTDINGKRIPSGY